MPDDKEFELDDLESFSFDDLSLDDAAPAGEGQDPEGVWVKSAPEDVTDAVSADAGAAPAEEAAPGEEPSSDGLAEEDFLSSEELANLDDSFDFVTVEEPQEGEVPIDDEVAFLDTPEAVAAEKAGNFDDVSLDDFVSFDDTAEPQTETILTPAADAAADEPEDDFPEEFLDIDIDIDDEIGDDILEVSTPPAAAAPAPSDDIEAEDIDLSEFGDFEEVSPAEPPKLDELDLPALDAPAASVDEAETEDGFFDEEIFEDAPVAALEPDDSTDMDHILALEEDLTSGIRESGPAEPAAASPAPAAHAGSDLAAAILGKIEQELSSIKQEISALKNEVTNLRVAPADPEPTQEAAAPAETPDETADDEKPAHGGFFDDDGDEAIALTGDELDNILSTAEVSEGEEAGVSLEDDLLDLDAEGNLIEPAPDSVELEGSVAAEEEEHVTDEEFLAGTALEGDDSFDALPGGVPESIELEEDLPLGLEDETEDLLVTDAGVLSDEPEALPPFEPEAVSLEPDLVSEQEVSVDLEQDEPLDDFEDDLAEEPAAAAVETPLPPTPPVPPSAPAAPQAPAPLASGLKDELRAVLSYMDKLLASLPDDKIQEFAESEHFEVYKRLFEELGLIE